MGYGPNDEVWPVTLLNTALSFARVADAAVARLGQISSATTEGLTILFLLAQSIELALKTFLLISLEQSCPPDENGPHDRQKSREYQQALKAIGHDLPKALRAVVAGGFPRPHSSDEKLLVLLNDAYAGRRRLQYRAPGRRNVPLLRPVRELAQQYLSEAHRAATGTVVDPCQVPGLGVDPAADYGAMTLEQFRLTAQSAPGLGDL
ncbi:MAG: hypothetical protein ACYCS1_12010 [Gammaproteobacteria bacterium]